jgi:V8-like Glu-specific endopeptidase
MNIPGPFDELEHYSDEYMFSNDALFEVPLERMSQPMHRHIGALLFRTRRHSQSGKGTGTLISRNLVLTSAHNIYN